MKIRPDSSPASRRPRKGTGDDAADTAQDVLTDLVRLLARSAVQDSVENTCSKLTSTGNTDITRSLRPASAVAAPPELESHLGERREGEK